MEMNVIYVGLDVDDTQHHGSALNKDTGEVIPLQCRPTLTERGPSLPKLAYSGTAPVLSAMLFNDLNICL